MTQWIVVIGLLLVLVATLVAGVSLYDLRRRREDRAMELQARLSDAMLLEPALVEAAVTPTVHASSWPRGPFTIAVAGAVPSPEIRYAALALVRRETAGIGRDVQIEDHIVVNPRMITRIA
jgi:hypothetical protein